MPLRLNCPLWCTTRRSNTLPHMFDKSECTKCSELNPFPSNLCFLDRVTEDHLLIEIFSFLCSEDELKTHAPWGKHGRNSRPIGMSRYDSNARFSLGYNNFIYFFLTGQCCAWFVRTSLVSSVWSPRPYTCPVPRCLLSCAPHTAGLASVPSLPTLPFVPRISWRVVILQKPFTQKAFFHFVSSFRDSLSIPPVNEV